MMQRFIRKMPLTSLTIMGLRTSTLGAKFLLTLFIARYLNLEALGAYGLITGFTVVAPVVIGMGLQNSLAREAVGQPLPDLTHNLRHYWSLLLALYTGLGMAAAVWGVATGHTELALAIAAITLLEHINQDTFILLTNLHRALLANVLMFIRAAGWIFIYMAAAIAFPALRSLESLLLFWLAGITLPLILFAVATRAWPWLQAFRSPFQKSWLTTHLKKSRLLFASDVFNASGQYADRYLVTLFLGLELSGVYVFFWQIANGVYNLANTGVMQLYRPKLIHAFNQKDEAAYWAIYRSLIRKTLLSVSLLSAVAIVATYILIPFTNKPVVAQYSMLVFAVLAATFMRIVGDLAAYGLLTRRLDAAYARSYGLSLLLITGFNLAFIPLVGIYAPAVTLVLALSIVTIYRKRNLA